MINHEDRHRIGPARVLRRQGKTYAEIRTLIGWVRDEDLARWLNGIPRPPETRRGNAQDDLRRRCRRMRSTGLTYEEIREATCDRSRGERLRQREDLIVAVSRQVGAMTDREILLVGAALYWAEGTKSKQWNLRDRLTFHQQ